MALITDSRFWAHDSSGNPLVGATLTIYDAGTTNLASIYRDSGLGVAMTNPTSGPDVSDSAGRFPQIFATEGALFDITLKTSAGVTVTSYEDVEAVGSGSSVITRDFGNSRIRIAGTGGVGSFEAGDPSGDNIGGQVRLGGYNNTQADTAEIDAAATSTTGTLATGGLITENSKKLYGVVAASGSVSAAANMIISLPTTIAGVMLYDVDVFSVKTSAATPDLRVTYSFDNGATYSSAASYTTNAAGATTYGTLIASAGTTNGYLHARLRFQQNDAGSNGVTLAGNVITGSDAPTLVSVAFIGVATPVTHIKIAPSSGTITGRWRVVPLRGTGDA